MSTYYFISKLRNLDIDGVPGGFRNYQLSTDDEAVAEKLRSNREVSEVSLEAKKVVPLPDASPAAVAEVEKKVEAIAEGGSPVVSGMRTSTTKEKKEKKSK